MEIGNKILEMRKEMGLSQEQLAEQMGVARQTISKWELGETSPDISQTKKLSEIFNVSVDDLINNDIKNILVNKIDNNEKVMKKIINILKIILLLIVIVVIVLLFYVFCKDYFAVQPSASMQSIECIVDGKEYSYEVWQTNETTYILDKIVTQDYNLTVDIKEYTNFQDALKAIKENVVSRGGKC